MLWCGVLCSQPGDVPLRPSSYYRYQLRGVVVHSGTALAGHYYSFIKASGASLIAFLQPSFFLPSSIAYLFCLAQKLSSFKYEKGFLRRGWGRS